MMRLIQNPSHVKTAGRHIRAILVSALIGMGLGCTSQSPHAVAETTNGGVKAQILSPYGLPVSDLPVIVRPADELSGVAQGPITTDSAGWLYVGELTSGEYLIEISPDSLQGLVIRQTVVSPDSVVNLGSRRLQFTGELRGNALTAGVDSVQKFTIHLLGMDRHVTPAADGSFSFGRVPAGTYAFAITTVSDPAPVPGSDQVSVVSNQITKLADLSLTDASVTPQVQRTRFPEITCWFDTGASARGFERYQANHTLLHELNPRWYALTDGKAGVDGTLSESASIDPAQVTAIHANGGIVLPTISAGAAGQIASLLSSEASRRALIENCIRTAGERGYDGWLMHFPEGAAESRDLFSGFVEALVDSLHRHGLFVSLSLPPISSKAEELQTHIDVQRLARLGVNSYKIFALHEASPSPAPIASYTRICATLDYLLQCGMEARKLQVALHTFARRWRQVGGGAFELTDRELAYESFAAVYAYGPDWSGEERESVASFSVNDTSWTVYLGDGRTTVGRLDLFDRYDILGFSLWTIGREDSTILSGIRAFFN